VEIPIKKKKVQQTRKPLDRPTLHERKSRKKKDKARKETHKRGTKGIGAVTRFAEEKGVEQDNKDRGIKSATKESASISLEKKKNYSKGELVRRKLDKRSKKKEVFVKTSFRGKATNAERNFCFRSSRTGQEGNEKTLAGGKPGGS